MGRSTTPVCMLAKQRPHNGGAKKNAPRNKGKKKGVENPQEMMDSPFQTGSREKKKSSSAGGDHHFPFFFPSLANDPNTWGSKVLFTQNCAAVSLSPTSRLNTSKRAHKKTTNSHGGKKREKNNKRSHGISTGAGKHAFRTSSRKVGQSKRAPGPSKLGRHRRLLCSLETFPPAPVPLEGRGPAECDPRRKKLLHRGQQNKSSHIANVRWAAPPHFHVIIARLRTCVSSRTPSFLKKPFRRIPQMQWTLESNKPSLAIAVSLTNHLQ
ncbi:hypothetical protein TCSYLVIO_010878 [Trypanosoma cruzi]|nr:hypothetical protein TCSYLVIO_010878 [Trypanosoma cruzi]